MKKTQQWKLQWGHEIAKSRYPNVFTMKNGGCLVRARVTDPMTGKLKEIKKLLPLATAVEASAWLEEQKKKAKTLPDPEAPKQTPRFAAYAASVLERMVDRGVGTDEHLDRWKYTLIHLIEGIYAEDDEHKSGKPVVPGLGDLNLSEIRIKTVEDWKTKVAKLIKQGRYAPNTANGWLSILKTILKSGRREYELSHNAIEDVEQFDTSKHETHTEEDPNALTREQVFKFLTLMRELYPQHYAMTMFGFATGLRGTNISPIRIKGPKADINWETGVCYVRRGAGRLGSIYNRTKQGTRYRITLPPSLLEVLRWHVTNQIPEGGRDSEYLFASEVGTPRLAVVLTKPFAEVSRQMGLPFNLSVHGMRRTYNDMALATGTNNLVTRSISGHLTEKMQEEYTSVWAPLQERAIGSIMDLMAGRAVVPQPMLPILRAVG